MTLFLPFIKGLHVDEKAWSLFEQDTLTDDGKELIRTQTIRVMRDGRLVEFTRVLGPSASFVVEPFAIASLGEDSVGKVFEMAEKIRQVGTNLQKAMDDHLDEINVIEQLQLRAEQINQYRRQNRRTVSNLRNH